MSDPLSALESALNRYDAGQDTDGERDYAEEAAVRAERQAENAAEQAHADLVAETARRLYALGAEAYHDAQQTLARFVEEVRFRLPPNVHRYELLARHQHTAVLAPTVASWIEQTGSYEVQAVAEEAVESYRTTHQNPATATTADPPNRALLDAIDRVVEVVREVTR